MREALLAAFALKDELRTGWVRAGVDKPESVAAHSWGVSFLVLLTLPPELDRERALIYAILHDLAEAWTGDITPHDGVSREDKFDAERAALTTFFEHLERPDLLEFWLAYEAQADDEACFVKQLDRLDMGLQAARYRSIQNLDLREFDRSARVGLTPELLALLPQDVP